MKSFLKVTTIVAIIAFVCSCAPKAEKPYNAGINIIPQPQSLITKNGEFKVTKSTKICVDTENAEVKAIAEYLQSKIAASTGYKIEICGQESNCAIKLTAGDKPKDESYTLVSSPEGIEVAGGSAHGLFNGVQSLLQLLPAEIESPTKVKDVEWTIPAVEIADYPRYPHRGILLDPGRQFIPVEDIKKQLDIYAMLKINILHWHLTEDQGWRVEIKKYPKLTEVGAFRTDGDGVVRGGFYTQEDIKEIVKYAAERYITVVPEIDLPGHMRSAIAAYPELSCKNEQVGPRIVWGIEENVLCAGKESTFEFLEDVFDELMPLFPSELVHIGGDECPKVRWETCPHCQAKIKELKIRGTKAKPATEQLQSYVMQRVEKYLADNYNKRVIGWDEILHGGVSTNTIIMSWRGTQGGIEAGSKGHDVIMTPLTEGMYINFYEGDAKLEPVANGNGEQYPLSKVYSYNPTPKELDNVSHRILGVQANVWGEFLYNTDIVEHMSFPRALALAEIGWTELKNKDYEDFKRRLHNALVRLDLHNINYKIPYPTQPYGSSNSVAFVDSIRIPFTISRELPMIYTLDGTEPNANSAQYSEPLLFTESTTLKIRTLLASGKMGETRTIDVRKEPLALATKPNKVVPGLKIKTLEGYYLNVDELPANGEWKEQIIKDLRDINRNVPAVRWDFQPKREDQYAAIGEGYIEVPEDGTYFVSSDLEEVWINGKLVINNRNEVKRVPRTDGSVALQAGLHPVKVVYLGHIIGGWPSSWNDQAVNIRHNNWTKFEAAKIYRDK